jgi:hypothetical protein
LSQAIRRKQIGITILEDHCRRNEPMIAHERGAHPLVKAVNLLTLPSLKHGVMLSASSTDG